MISKKTLTITTIIGLVIIGLFLFVNKKPEPEPIKEEPVEETPEEIYPKHSVIGQSVKDRAIEAFTYGDGEKHLLFIGGIHGGYEWNSTYLAYRFIDYLDEEKIVVPDNIKITVIPVANPDGLFKVVGKEGRFTVEDVPEDDAETIPGRFNANEVDLNRNFDCRWAPESTWRSKVVKAGTEAFSEPESKALRDFVLANKPSAIVSWHSQANAVYASECGEGILPETLDIMNTYANASGYNAVDSFDAYPVTGDADSWFAKIGIPAITVEMKTHYNIEWDQNLAAINALINYYKNK